MGGQAKIEIQEKAEVITAQDDHTLIGETKMEDFRLQLWLSRFTAQQIDDMLHYIHLLKMARANDSFIGGSDMKESEYYLRKVNMTIDYITQKRVDTSRMHQR